MARTGRPRKDIQPRPIDHLEAFCCRQVERIEQTLNHRYGLDLWSEAPSKIGRLGGVNKSWLLNTEHKNDHMVRKAVGVDQMQNLHDRFVTDCDVEVRK